MDSGKGSFFIGKNFNPFEELDWMINNWNWYQVLTVLNCNTHSFQQLYKDWNVGTKWVWNECCPSMKTIPRELDDVCGLEEIIVISSPDTYLIKF